jgi:dimethylhistidine N-methyltransferase
MHPTLTRFSDRLEIVSVPHSAHVVSFGEDVAAGLRASPKRLSSKFFYDELGSALFEAITHLPEYYLTRAETEILAESGWQIVRALEEPVEFLELGSGSAMKTRVLIDEALRAQGSLRYSPIDISADALRSSAVSLVDAYRALRIRAYAADYFDILGSPHLTFEGRVLAMFMGSNIGNYDPPSARALLLRVAASLRTGDGLLIGADLKKDRATLEAAYDDPTGVTAAFNKNLLGRINRELGGMFDLRDFVHVARYDEVRGCVDSYLEARRAHRVRIAALELEVQFDEGERIHTESSYKFDREAMAELGAASGFTLKTTWTDAASRFGVHLLIRE